MKLLLFFMLCCAASACAKAPDYCTAAEVPDYIKYNAPHVFDGPTELPRRCVATNPWNMPSPLGTVSVAAGESLQSAYNSALCGTTIKLAHGATWTGPFNFAPKDCADADWITIESDGKLPNVGVRALPADSPQMAKIVTTGSKASTFGDHLRFVGIEWGTVDATSLVYNLAVMRGSSQIVFERNWFHGNPGQDVQRGIHLGTGKYIGVIDSYFSEFHCTTAGLCIDAQALGGGSGEVGDLISQSGPFKIVNNFLEGSAENIILGGGIADGCPTDITVQNNHFYKPQSWNPSDPTFIGTKYITKNLFELKNACRVLVEGNIFDNTWGGFSQLGFAILFTPKNQAGANGAHLCPACTVTDITFRYNHISTAGGAFMVGSGASGTGDTGGWSQGQHRTSIHDNLADNLQYATCFSCGTSLVQLGSGYFATNPPPASSVLSDVLFANNSLIAVGDLSGAGRTSQLLSVGGPPVNTLGIPQITNVSFINNVAYTLKSGMYSDGGGTNNCMYFAPKPQTPASEWPTCFKGTSPFTGNYLIGPLALKWPADNTQSATMGTIPAGVGANMILVNQYTAGAK